MAIMVDLNLVRCLTKEEPLKMEIVNIKVMGMAIMETTIHTIEVKSGLLLNGQNTVIKRRGTILNMLIIIMRCLLQLNNMN